MSSYYEESVAAAVETLQHIHSLNPKRPPNAPLKYHFCPLCKTVKLQKDTETKTVWKCPQCGLTISPNVKGKQK